MSLVYLFRFPWCALLRADPPHPAPLFWGGEVPKKEIVCSAGVGAWTCLRRRGRGGRGRGRGVLGANSDWCMHRPLEAGEANFSKPLRPGSVCSSVAFVARRDAWVAWWRSRTLAFRRLGFFVLSPFRRELQVVQQMLRLPAVLLEDE